MLEKDDKIGDYRLERFLGRGQFGEVWLAEKQLQFSTRSFRHALKFLFNAGDEIDLKAAEAEIDTWIEASGHPNVMSVLDMILYKDYIIIISEFAEGGSIKNWLTANGGRAPSTEKALEMMTGILRGIEHLHSRNVVHRDLKPDNILLQGNFPRITDFGISRIVSSGSMSTKAMGSPAYMSPESFAGNKSPQNDIWSAGVILYEMLTGDFPFESETIYGLVAAIERGELKPLPETLSPELRQIVENALQKDRAERFQTAREMRLAVERASHNLKVKAESDVPDPKTLKIDIPDEKMVENLVEALSVETIKIENPAEETLPLPMFPTQASKTQSAETIETVNQTVGETRDWRELEDERARREQTELKNFGHKFKQTSSGKRVGTAFLAVGGAVFGIALLIGGLFWAMSGNPAPAANTKADNSAKAPVNTTADNSTKTNTPTAPDGMAYIPGGEFMMGRDDGKSEAEKPAHKVSVEPFFMDITEVTVQKYNDPETQTKGLPKVGVNWEEADAFCKKTGKRLPTEEEWEFAARGTENFIYPWGNVWKEGNANVGGKSFAEVGAFKGASPFGIYDMSGNAWEWTSSDFKAYPNGKLPADFAGKTNLKTIRGGSFEATKDFATGTYRIGWAATGAVNYDRTCFRCVKDVK